MNAFPRCRRLLDTSAFGAVFRQNWRFRGRGFVIAAAPGETRVSRLGQAIAKRNAPRAVDRNRIKRIVRESFRCRRGFGEPLDLVVTIRRGAQALSNRDLFDDLDCLWQRIDSARGRTLHRR